MKLTNSLPMMLLISFLSGCLGSDCDWAEPVRPAKGDDLIAAPGLSKSALAHNLAGAENCGWKP